jgi:hypothetical protein
MAMAKDRTVSGRGSKRSFDAIAALLGSMVALTLGGCASVPPPQKAGVPENLRVPEGQQLLLHAAARGAQIYVCKAKTDEPLAFAWVLQAPEAELFDPSGTKIGRHYAGPTWETADGSRVEGEVLQRSPVEGAIPALLLRAKSTGGSGLLASTQYVQRLDTVGGVAPAAGCDEAHAGTRARVDYSATYDFYGQR